MRSSTESDTRGLRDESLAIRVAGGNSAALEVLYDRYAAIVLGLTLRIIGERASAEDVVQETFWRVWRGAETFQPQRGSFASWLFRIVRNLSIDVYRRRTQGIPADDDGASILEQTPDACSAPPEGRSRRTLQLLADRLVELKFERHYTPEHGSWLNMAEIELSILSRQCAKRRMANKIMLAAEVSAWQKRRNTALVQIDRQFKVDVARIKLKRLYPVAIIKNST